MPYYDYRCRVCAKTEAHYQKIIDRDLPQYHCGTDMTRVITAAAIRPDIQAYVSPASGKLINSRAQRSEDMRREGCIENEPGVRQWVEQNRLSDIEKSLKSVDAGIDATVSAMHSSGLI